MIVTTILWIIAAWIVLSFVSTVIISLAIKSAVLIEDECDCKECKAERLKWRSRVSDSDTSRVA